MFRRLPDSDLATTATVPLTIDGQPFVAHVGDTVAAALLAAGRATFRTTPVTGAPRGPFCLMGSCQECVVEADGRRVAACQEPVRAGLEVRSGMGGGTR